MTSRKHSNLIEKKFWGFAIKAMKADGLLVKEIKSISSFSHSKAGFYSLCLLVWAAVGFFLGLVLGKIYWFFQFY